MLGLGKSRAARKAQRWPGPEAQVGLPGVRRGMVGWDEGSGAGQARPEAPGHGSATDSGTGAGTAGGNPDRSEVAGKSDDTRQQVLSKHLSMTHCSSADWVQGGTEGRRASRPHSLLPYQDPGPGLPASPHTPTHEGHPLLVPPAITKVHLILSPTTAERGQARLGMDGALIKPGSITSKWLGKIGWWAPPSPHPPDSTSTGHTCTY